jgi:hypothetical protein
MSKPPLLTSWPPAFKVIGVPPLELLLPFLDEPHPVSGHVGWDGCNKEHPETDFKEATREAIYRWPIDRLALDKQGDEIEVTPARYPVVRVLFWHLNNAREPRTVIENKCGIAACCNTDHWRVKTAKEMAGGKRIAVFTAFDSQDYKRER